MLASPIRVLMVSLLLLAPGCSSGTEQPASPAALVDASHMEGGYADSGYADSGYADSATEAQPDGTIDCSKVGCAAPPPCGQPCLEVCGCCPDTSCTDAGQESEAGSGTDGSPEAASGPSLKKGVGTWFMKSVDANLTDLQLSWWYAWGPSPAAQTINSTVPFVPMIWDESHVTAQELAEAKKHGSVLLGFNEPDHTDQADMTVAQALELWPELMATGMRLGSPATAENPAVSGSWLDQFMKGAKDKDHRVDFICVHWYGADFETAAAVEQLRGYLQGVHDHFGLPIWLTEYSLINWMSTPKFPTWAQQAAFAAASVAMLETLAFVERYAWFSMPPYSDDVSETIYLYDESGAITKTGEAYKAAGVL
jgi:hypothetical protein